MASRGPKGGARQVEGTHRQGTPLMGELADLELATRSGSARIDFSATERQTRRLLEFEGVHYGIGGRRLFEGLDLLLPPARGWVWWVQTAAADDAASSAAR